jgi:hypothetical protein
VGELSYAGAKLAEGKFEDALVKLTQFREKVVALGSAGKLDANDVTALAAGADEAIACVQSHL